MAVSALGFSRFPTSSLSSSLASYFPPRLIAVYTAISTLSVGSEIYITDVGVNSFEVGWAMHRLSYPPSCDSELNIRKSRRR